MKKILFVLLFVLLFVVYPTLGLSTTFYVWTYGDDNNTGLSWNVPFATLQKAIASAQAGDTILVGYDDQNGTVYEINSAIVVNQSVVISSARFGVDQSYSQAVFDSSRCILDANFNNRLMSVEQKVEIRGLGFKHGNGSVGSSYYYGYGGAILLTGDNTAGSRIHHCAFDSNYAAYANSDGYGGAIAVESVSGVVTIQYNRFSGNRGTTGTGDTGYGGAVYVKYADVLLANNQFYGNTASEGSESTGYGGAVYVSPGDTLSRIQNNLFQNNTATKGIKGHGGAVAVENGVRIENNEFYQNVASRGTVENYLYYGIGGAIYGNYGTEGLKIVGNTIRQNIASTDSVTGEGGGIYLYSSGNSLIENNVIEDNIATQSPHSGSGGGIAVSGYNTFVIIKNNTITGNVAAQDNGEGGGIYTEGGWIEGNTITENVASVGANGTGKGGGIYNDGHTTIINNHLERNVAGSGADGSGWGGGIATWAFDDGAMIYENVFKENISSGGYSRKGGAIFLADTSQVFYNVFYHNMSYTNPQDYEGYGGDGIYIYYAAKDNLRIHHNVFYRHAQAITADYLTFGSLNNDNIMNNIFYNLGDERPLELVYSDGSMTISNNCFYGYQFNTSGSPLKYNASVYSYAEVDADPRVDTTTFALQYDSPCIDAGNAKFTYDENENHQYGWKEDIGIHEYSGTQVRRYLTSAQMNDTLFFGGEVRAKIVFKNGTIDADAYVDIIVHPGQAHSTVSNGVQRYVTITTAGISNYQARLVLSYRDSELNGNPEGELYLIRFTSSSHLEGPYRTAMDTVNNWIAADGIQALDGDWLLTTDTTVVAIQVPPAEAPRAFRLYPAYPNPFNPSTRIVVDIPRATEVRLSVFDVFGREVRVLTAGRLLTGKHVFQWDGKDESGKIAPSGMYFVRLKTRDYTGVQKLLLMK